MKRVIVFGANGQLGAAFLKSLKDCEVIGVTRKQCDFSDPMASVPILDRYTPRLVINCAAYTAVDRAESEPALARSVNALAPQQIAQWCAKHGASLLHFSTDYVFSGRGSRPWVESDPCEPLSVYGKTKLEGERLVIASGARYWIVRTSWLYDAVHENFFTKIMHLSRERPELKIVDDQIGAPTYVPELARVLARALGHPTAFLSSEIFHLCNESNTSWAGFARAFLDPSATRILPITSAQFAAPALRPLNSRLCTDKFYVQFGLRLRDWREGLAACREDYHAHHQL